jgi:hypothetical protein
LRASHFIFAAALVLAPRARAAEEAADLAKQVQNPVADLTSVPFQYNATLHVGPSDDVLHVLNIQPVVPLPLSATWNLILRAILPLISQPGLSGRTNGLGDINLQPLFSPHSPGRLIWGVGPALVLPTATSDSLGAGKWSAGPVGVLFVMEGPWVIGALVQNVWSFAGDSARPDVNQLTIQPAINYNLPDAWALNYVPLITADWNAASGDRWTVPLGATLSKVTSVGGQHLNLSAGAFWNAVHPAGAGNWLLRAQIAFLFPHKPKS